MIHLGAAYYPEQWPEERWLDDIHLMKQAGLTVVRMAEFAWSTLEPSEGEFQFEWLARAVSLLAEHGIVSVLGTPTAAPPAWLTHKYPETLAIDEYSRQAQHGNRCHACVNSPDYQTLTQRVVKAMAQHFGASPHIIGWQIDNEFNRVCYCPRCQAKFREFLRSRYQTLDRLNSDWSTAYWSQAYTDWEEVPLPIGPHNPGLMLEFKRFITDSYRRYQSLQLHTLRPYLQEGVWVTHNFMGWFDGFDHYTLSDELDLVSWDCYVGTGHHDWPAHAATHDLTRGFKRKNFWLMETQPGNVNWSSINNVLNQGEGRAMAWQAIGHGADAILYWQWRSAYGGQEQYHGTLVDQSGQLRPFFEEVQLLGEDLATVTDLLDNTQPTAKIALLNDYESRWSIQWQKHHCDFDYVKHLLHYYSPIAHSGIPMDIISADALLQGYQVVIAPALLITDEDRASTLADFVENGGHLVLTLRSGMKNRMNALIPARQPGPLLSDIAGVEVEEYYALDEPVPITGDWLQGQSQQWAERLNLLDGRRVSVIARYGKSNGWLDDQAAITSHSYGRGLVYYVGAYLDEAAQAALVERVLKTARVHPPFRVPAGIEICQRTDADGKPVYFVINHEQHPQSIALPWEARDLINRAGIKGVLELDTYGIAIISRL